MLRLFLCSHGKLASGIKSSLNVLLGNTDKLVVFDAYLDEQTVEGCLNEFYRCINKDDQVILLSDLYCGSVNQQMFLYLDKPNTTLIAGVNLSLVLELMIKEQPLTKAEIADLVRQSREMLRVVEMDVPETQDGSFF